jgi:hypothetical protein
MLTTDLGYNSLRPQCTAVRGEPKVMSVSTTGKRKIVVNGRVFFWRYDFGVHVFIVSADKRFLQFIGSENRRQKILL